ncbi:alpha/beta hydrolase [Natrialbaceae archaeon GCM10025810]|uniref:alpha/beta hydrolase n=1 Tax=Halovalidus salilacus TaxID=3075124 RepID=UPI00361DBD71
MATEESDASSGDAPHPEIEGMLEMMSTMPSPPFRALSAEGARTIAGEMFPLPDDPEPVGDVMDLLIPGPSGDLPIRVYVPEVEGPHPALIYLHGGGWVVGDTDMFDPTCRALTNAAERIVVSVDYRLAPEHPFPAPVKDSYAAAEWVMENAEAMQIDADRVAIGGDSAGGQLAASVAQLARDRDGPSFERQVLIYPVTDYAFDTPSYEENAEGYLLSKADMQWFWEQYLRDEIDGRNPYAAPLQANDLSDLPPATVVTCGFDPLRDEGAAYAEKLEEAGVDVNHIKYDDCIHGAIQMLVEPLKLTRAEEMIEDVAADLAAE